jgi:SagB-type dehydrogenase family enzyme
MERDRGVVAAGDGRTSLARELEWQNVSSKLSKVRPVSCPVDPMRRYWFLQRPFVARGRHLAARLRAVQNLFEWAYGYREPMLRGQRFTRRSPSAGALYPTELFLVIETTNGWRVLYYYFLGHQFYLCPVLNPEVVASLLGLASGRYAILLNSVLWRTVQRYGVRGYRYCLLDAAHVATNLVRAASACGHELCVTTGVLTNRLEDALELSHGEALTVSLINRCKSDAEIPAPAVPASPPSAETGMGECPPLLCPVLSRVVSFHRVTLHSHPRQLQNLPIRLKETFEELRFWGQARTSARDFTGDFVSYERYAQISKAAVRPPVYLLGFVRTIAYVIRLRVTGMPPGCDRLILGPTVGLTTSASAEDLDRRLWLACLNQDIVKSSAFAIVLAVPKSELVASGHIAYRHAVLNAGSICAELYREAARHAVGTTSIGGFSDAAICCLVGDPDVHPIVIQAFGVASVDREKLDVARVIGVPPVAPSRE